LILLLLDYYKSLKRCVPKTYYQQVIIRRILGLQDATSYIESNCVTHLLTAVAYPVWSLWYMVY